MKKNNENTNAFLIHISAFAGFVFPLGDIITPLIAWQTLKDRSPFLDKQGKEAVNFNLSYSLYLLILGISILPFFFAAIFSSINEHHYWNWSFDFGNLFGVFSLVSMVGILGIVKFILIIIAAMKVKEGEDYKYPFTIKFIK
jgi:hypothetical protein